MVENLLASAFVKISVMSALILGGGLPSPLPGRNAPAVRAPVRPDPGFRAAVRAVLIRGRGIARLTRRAPVLGGRWEVGSERDIHYLGDHLVAIDYEDGHIAGRLIARIMDPSDVSTWQIVRDEER
jgi:hypothetical protein